MTATTYPKTLIGAFRKFAQDDHHHCTDNSWRLLVISPLSYILQHPSQCLLYHTHQALQRSVSKHGSPQSLCSQAPKKVLLYCLEFSHKKDQFFSSLEFLGFEKCPNKLFEVKCLGTFFLSNVRPQQIRLILVHDDPEVCNYQLPKMFPPLGLPNFILGYCSIQGSSIIMISDQFFFTEAIRFIKKIWLISDCLFHLFLSRAFCRQMPPLEAIFLCFWNNQLCRGNIFGQQKVSGHAVCKPAHN